MILIYRRYKLHLFIIQGFWLEVFERVFCNLKIVRRNLQKKSFFIFYKIKVMSIEWSILRKYYLNDIIF